MIISLLLPLLLVRKRKNIRSSFETRSLGKLVKMMIRWLTDFLCGVFSFKTIFWKRVRAFWVPSSSVHWVFLNPRIRHQRNIRSLRRSLKQEEFFFFWKIENHNYCPTQVLSSCFFLVAKFQNPRHSLNKKQQEQEENILPIFLKFPRLWPPEYFFFGNKRNFYLSLSLSVCVCVSWKRKKKNWPFLLCFGDTFWIFFGRIGSEIRLDAKLDFFGRNYFLDWTRLEGSRFANGRLSHISKKMLSSRRTKLKRFKTQKLDKKDKIWNHLEKFEKRILRGKSKNCPRAPEKNEKNSPRKLGIFLVGTRRGETKFAYERKKNVGFFLSFCSPVALQMARFCAEAKQWRDQRKHFAETKQRILRKRRRRKEKRNHHSSLPQRDISHCIRINCWNNQVKHKCCPSLLLLPTLIWNTTDFDFCKFLIWTFFALPPPWSFDFPR